MARLWDVANEFERITRAFVSQARRAVEFLDASVLPGRLPQSPAVR